MTLLVAGAEDKQALNTWIHEDTGSYGAAVSPDGKYLLTGSIGGYGRVWDLAKNKVLYSVQHQDNNEGGIIAAAFSARSEVLVTIEQQSIARWSVKTGRLTGYWYWPDLTDVDISADGRYALIGRTANQAAYFEWVEGNVRDELSLHETVTSVALSRV